ncbi:MAG TPA: hypothetical protein VD995_12620 [Azospirillum sp.]|nr:hypothetical protein [Azospirillum sp.]
MNAVTSNDVQAPDTAPFTTIAPGLGFGRPLPAGWRPLAETELLVLVGVTGAGKSTALAALDQRRVAYNLLPDRRVVTDRVIIPLYDGGAVLDRVRRFEITQRFTRDCPGGMAAVLAGMAADAHRRALPLVFDGLRGEVEVTHAAAALPNARFLVLTAPDAVRLNRLLRRGDAFDRATTTGAASTGDLDLPGAEEILAPSDIERLRADVAAGVLTADDVRGKFAIIAAERRNYDPDRTVAALLAHAPERTAVVDTTVCGPAEVGAALAGLLAGERAEAAA